MTAAPAPEETLVLACARAFLGQEVARPDPRGVRWPLFVERLVWHGLHATLHSVVRGWYGAEIPEEAAGALRAAVRHQAAHNLRLLAALGEIDAALRAAGVPYVVLKGLPLAQATYGSLSARRCRDVDLLVPPAAFREARRALEGLGFHSDWPHHPAHEEVWLRFSPDLPLTRRDGALVELHAGFEPHAGRDDDARVRSLLAAATPIRLGAIEVPAVVGPPALPYLAWHGTRHAWFRLFWLLDVATLTARAPQAELDAAWHAASGADGRRSLALAWKLAADLLGVPVPAAGQGALEDPTVVGLARRTRERARSLAEEEPHAPAARRAAALRWSLALAPGPLARARLIAHYLVAVQPEDVAAVPLPPSLRWLYPALRPARVALRLAAALAGGGRLRRGSGSSSSSAGPSRPDR